MESELKCSNPRCVGGICRTYVGWVPCVICGGPASPLAAQSLLDLDAQLAIVRRRTPGLLQFIGSDEYPRALWGSTGAMVAIAAKSTKYPEELVIKIAPNDQQAIVTAVNNFEVVAVRCKQAEERADKWFAKACERNALLKLEEARTADLTRQLVELSAVCDAMKAAGCHERKCHNCGFVMFAADGVIPYVTCKRCGSNDTRRQQERSETVDSTCVIENADEAI